MRMDWSIYLCRLLKSTVPDLRARGRPTKRCVEGVYDAIKARAQNVKEVKVCVNDRVNWKRMYGIRR